MSRAHRIFAIFAALWILAMTGRIYPQFKDTLRLEGRTLTVDEFMEDACGERVGAAATSCRTAATETAERALAVEQAKSLLLIEAPLVAYALFYLPVRLLRGHRGRTS